jgi:hypothetical protein
MQLNDVIKNVGIICRSNPDEYLTIEDLVALIERDTGELVDKSTVNRASVILVDAGRLYRVKLDGTMFRGFGNTYAYFVRENEQKRMERSRTEKSILLPEPVDTPRMLAPSGPDRDNAVDAKVYDFDAELTDEHDAWLARMSEETGLSRGQLVVNAVQSEMERVRSAPMVEMIQVLSDRVDDHAANMNERLASIDVLLKELVKEWKGQKSEHPAFQV